MTYLPAVAAVLAAGCSLVYNPDNLSSRGDGGAGGGTSDGSIGDELDAPIDPMHDAAVAVDAAADATTQPMPLEIDSISPTTVVEGTGSGGSRPALVIVTGKNIASGAMFSVGSIQDGGVTRTVPVLASAVSSDHRRAALALQIPVLTTVADGATIQIHVTATQGAETAGIDVAIHGLDELAVAGAINTSTLRPLYSHATFTGATHFTGSAPALVRVTSDITLDATVDVDGQGATPGAHGCAGGIQASGGACGTSGGGGGDSSLSGSAGGGGGFGTAGSTGKGNSPGAGGAGSGDDMLLVLTTNPGAAGNRGNGGGGGGGALLGGGGPGGGGGGVLELTADGAISVAATARASAAGGNGTSGGGIGGGNGGGGAGGAIVIRAGAGMAAHAGWIGAPGGSGAGSGSTAGGAGSIGRVRVESPASTAGMVSTPIPVRGAAWSTAAPMIVRTPGVSVQVIGDAGRTYPIVLGTTAQPSVTAGADGTAMVNATLASGINTLCALASPSATLGHAEAFRCIQITYLP